MTRYEFKCNRELADEIMSGNRMFDLRPMKYPFRAGDRIHYHLVDKRKEPEHKINHMEFVVTSILVAPYIAEGHAVIGIRPVARS